VEALKIILGYAAYNLGFYVLNMVLGAQFISTLVSSACLDVAKAICISLKRIGFLQGFVDSGTYINTLVT